MSHDDAFGAEFRAVMDREKDGKPARVVAAARTYATSADDLWNALTKPDRIARWFLPISGELVLGGSYQLQGNAGGKILRCDPSEAIDITWEFGGQISWVELRLTPDGDGTRLALEHIMPKDPDAEAHWDKFGPGATGVGWDLSFLGLGRHLDSGGAEIDRKAEEVWMASPQGKAFMRGSAAAWAVAHIAADEVPATAQAMAKRTGDFYTGESSE